MIRAACRQLQHRASTSSRLRPASDGSPTARLHGRRALRPLFRTTARHDSSLRGPGRKKNIQNPWTSRFQRFLLSCKHRSCGTCILPCRLLPTDAGEGLDNFPAARARLSWYIEPRSCAFLLGIRRDPAALSHCAGILLSSPLHERTWPTTRTSS